MKKIIGFFFFVFLLVYIIFDLVEVKNLRVAQNSYDDVVGILKIPSLDIEEFVVQGSDNEFYLNHDIGKNEDIKGSIFLDYRIDSGNKKLIIYGHNSKTIDVPFRKLEAFYDEDFFRQDKKITLVIDDIETTYQVFSVFVELDDWSYLKLNVNDWIKHLEYLKEKSWYKTDINFDLEDEILILQTCSYHSDFSNFAKKYLVIVAKRVK